jgi:Tfp pilus assembly PilM family ATPase
MNSMSRQIESASCAIAHVGKNATRISIWQRSVAAYYRAVSISYRDFFSGQYIEKGAGKILDALPLW